MHFELDRVGDGNSAHDGFIPTFRRAALSPIYFQGRPPECLTRTPVYLPSQGDNSSGRATVVIRPLLDGTECNGDPELRNPGSRHIYSGACSRREMTRDASVESCEVASWPTAGGAVSVRVEGVRGIVGSSDGDRSCPVPLPVDVEATRTQRSSCDHVQMAIAWLQERRLEQAISSIWIDTRADLIS